MVRELRTEAPEGLGRAVRELGTLRACATEVVRESRRAVEALLRVPGLAEPGRFAPRVGTYERHLLHNSPARGFSVWLITWAPRAATPIHDHHCCCAFGIASGLFEESWYRERDGLIVEERRFERLPGYVSGVDPAMPNIHRLANVTDAVAISIHIYGFDAERLQSSVAREFAPPRTSLVPGAKRATELRQPASAVT